MDHYLYSQDAPPLRFLECQGWDSDRPENSLWGFCILRGQYLKRHEATGYNRFIPPPCLPTPPTSKRRRRGDGSGYIQLHYHKSKKGKSYDQYYYDTTILGMRRRGFGYEVRQLYPPKGEAVFYRNIRVWKDAELKAHLALASVPNAKENWAIITDAPPSLEIFYR